MNGRLNLRQTLRAERNSIISFVGAGGKTTAMFQLARQLQPPVLVSCTTHLGVDQSKLADLHTIVDEASSKRLDLDIPEACVILLTGKLLDDARWKGLSARTIKDLIDSAVQRNAPLLIESDGSRCLPLKAPALHEPAIPAGCNHVVVVAGLSGIGNTLNSNNVHRAEVFSALSGRPLGEKVTVEDLEKVLLSADGGLKNIPARARRTVLLNQVGKNFDPSCWDSILKALKIKYDSVIIAELKDENVFQASEQISGIILAAGGSDRFGTPKQLAEWNGKPLIRWVAEAAVTSQLSEVIVVTGAVDLDVRKLLVNLPVKFVNNPDWASGQASSIQAGLKLNGPQTGASIFLLGDQPQVQSELINTLISAHSRRLGAVIAPEFAGKRGNPVLFDRSVFSALHRLTGDVGGRAIFNEFSPDMISWRDASIFMDIDVPDDLLKLSNGNH